MKCFRFEKAKQEWISDIMPGKYELFKEKWLNLDVSTNCLWWSLVIFQRTIGLQFLWNQLCKLGCWSDHIISVWHYFGVTIFIDAQSMKSNLKNNYGLSERNGRINSPTLWAINFLTESGSLWLQLPGAWKHDNPQGKEPTLGELN